MSNIGMSFKDVLPTDVRRVLGFHSWALTLRPFFKIFEDCKKKKENMVKIKKLQSHVMLKFFSGEED